MMEWQSPRQQQQQGAVMETQGQEVILKGVWAEIGTLPNGKKIYGISLPVDTGKTGMKVEVYTKFGQMSRKVLGLLVTENGVPMLKTLTYRDEFGIPTTSNRWVYLVGE
jgi:hypothetical protein